MNYINYKKNTLNKLKVSDINMPIPNLKNENKTQVISEWLIQWLDSVDFNNYLLPTKAEFAYSLGVSLGTVQNVFKILEDKGYIVDGCFYVQSPARRKIHEQVQEEINNKTGT